MSILIMLAIATGESQEAPGFLRNLLHHPVSVVGVLVMFSGIALGNWGMWKMMDAAESAAPIEREMFSTGAATSPMSPPKKRAVAIKKYRETRPDGPYFKILRLGQVLAGVGFFVMLIGAFL